MGKKVSDEELIESYSKTGNVWKTGKEVGIGGQSVWQRLKKLGVCKGINRWTANDDDILLRDYARYKQENRLDDLAKSLGRTKQFVCRKAKVLGLTNRKEHALAEKVKEKLSKAQKEWHSTHEHQRGYLGHKHSKEDLEKMSIWEVEVAMRLQSLLQDGAIKGWKYEAKHFDFTDIKRGIRSYCPDFDVTLLDGSMLYIEVKGWQIGVAMKRISMFKERYPDKKFYLIDKDEYSKVISESNYLRRHCV